MPFFWKFTPSGSAELSFKGPSIDSRGKEYSPGDYYYIDMVRSDDGGYRLSEVSHTSPYTGSVRFCTNGKETVGWNEGDGFTYGKLSVGLDHTPALDCFDKAGDDWDVTFTWAEASDD